MIIQILRNVFCALTLGAIATGALVVLAHWGQLPPSVPAHISSDGHATGAMAKWSLFLPLIIETIVTTALLASIAPGNKPKTPLAWLGTWLALASGFWLVTDVNWQLIDAALRPGTLHPMQVRDFACIGGILAGVVLALLGSLRRPGENYG